MMNTFVIQIMVLNFWGDSKVPLSLYETLTTIGEGRTNAKSDNRGKVGGGWGWCGVVCGG